LIVLKHWNADLEPYVFCAWYYRKVYAILSIMMPKKLGLICVCRWISD